MAGYFSLFPKRFYNNVLLTDLAINVRLKSSWLSNPKIYYEYAYQDHDRPEHIALKYYGKETYHWIILFTNSIFDVNFDFPMKSVIFDSYIEDKYKAEGALVGKTGMTYALTTPDPVLQYQKKVSMTSSSRKTENYYVISKEEFENLGSTSKTVLSPDGEYIIYEESIRFPAVTIYEKENDINESKRKIKILKKEFVQQAKAELVQLLK